MRLKSLVLLLFALSGLPALATPGRSASSSDRLLAANATSFYVLREIADNRGTYYGEFRDQYLVEISFDSNLATRFWLLRRLTLTFEESTDPFSTWQEEDVPPVDMMAILRENRAIPILQVAGVEPDHRFSFQGDSLVEVAGAADPLLLARIGVLVRRQLNPIARTYSPDPAEDWMGSRISLEPLGFNPSPICTVLEELPPFLRKGGLLAGLRLECYFDSEVYNSARFYLFLPVSGY